MEQFGIMFFFCFFFSEVKVQSFFENHNNCFHIIIIMLTSLSNCNLLNHTFTYIVKMDLRGYILLFLFLLKNIDCGY